MIEYENLNKLNSIYKKEFIEGFESFLTKDKFILGDNVKKFENNFSNFCGDNLWMSWVYPKTQKL